MTRLADPEKRWKRSLEASCSTYHVRPRYWWRWMWAWLRSRGVRRATRYHDKLKIALIAGRALREPLPEGQAQPVDHLVRPDPHEPATVDLDLAHALHPWTQPVGRVLQTRLHAEIVTSLARRRDGRHLVDAERRGIARRGREQQLPPLSHRDVRHLALVDL